MKNDPKLVAAARELRDRWLERVNTAGLMGHGKYDVSRALEAPADPSPGAVLMPAGRTTPALPAVVAA